MTIKAYRGVAVMKEIRINIKKIEEGKIKGQSIAYAEGEGYKIIFDIIKDIYSVEEGGDYVLEIREEAPGEEELAKYVFCGHGYLVTDILSELKEKYNYSIISIWGLIFKFEPKINELKPNTKYYVCIRPVE